jgi:hypothetical protein
MIRSTMVPSTHPERMVPRPGGLGKVSSYSRD